MCFHDEQVICIALEQHVCLNSFYVYHQVVCYREDPRLREQEWGNFQDPSHMTEIMEERRKTGAFYYRFPTGER